MTRNRVEASEKKEKFVPLLVDKFLIVHRDFLSLPYSQSTPLVQALSDLGNSCVLEDTVPLELYESRNWVHKRSTMCIYIYLL